MSRISVAAGGLERALDRLERLSDEIRGTFAEVEEARAALRAAGVSTVGLDLPAEVEAAFGVLAAAAGVPAAKVRS